MNLADHIMDIRIFNWASGKPGSPIKEFLIQGPIKFVCISGIDQRVHNMLLKNIGASLRAS